MECLNLQMGPAFCSVLWGVLHFYEMATAPAGAFPTVSRDS